MNEEMLKNLLEQLDSELNGDAEHDGDVLNDWLERYGEDPEMEPLVKEIVRRIVFTVSDEPDEVIEDIFNEMIAETDDIYDEACTLTAKKEYEKALELLEPVIQDIQDFPLPMDTIWMDFNSYLDSLVYQDYFAGQIGERQIGRHPLKPGRILFAVGTMLIELGRAEEAVEPLKMLLSYDPVCPRYLFELGEAYKRTGQIREAYENALWTLACVSKRQDLARCYRDLAYCLAERAAYEDAMMLNLLSLRFQSSRHADTEIAWIRKQTGLSPAKYTFEMIMNRCAELGIPVGISETVANNIELLKNLDLSSDDNEPL